MKAGEIDRVFLKFPLGVAKAFLEVHHGVRERELAGRSSDEANDHARQKTQHRCKKPGREEADALPDRTSKNRRSQRQRCRQCEERGKSIVRSLKAADEKRIGRQYEIVGCIDRRPLVAFRRIRHLSSSARPSTRLTRASP